MTVSPARRAADVVAIVRLPSCLAGAASVVLGAHLATGDPLPGGRGTLAAVGIGSAVAFANVVNDIVDRPVDAIAKPHRPLPSGRLSVRTAKWLATGLAAGALVPAAPLGPGFALWMLLLLALAAAYSLRLKNSVLAGNVVVAACAASPIPFGAAAVGDAPAAVWVATGLAFGFMLSYETLKTLVDVDGDTAGGLRTFATRVGPRASRRLFRALIVALTALALAAVAVSPTPAAYVVAVAATFVAPSWSAMALLGTKTGPGPLRTPVLLMRVAWFLGIFALWQLR
jgi:geranylgeranylglycerol-phosphate geranylgeranyltransferase